MKDNDFLIELQIGFCENLESRLGDIVDSILKLEKDDSPEKKNQVLRYLIGEFHSIKGSAGALQFKIIKTICHKVEDIIISHQEESGNLKIDQLLKYCDAMSEYSQMFKIDKIVNDQLFLKIRNLTFDEVKAEADGLNSGSINIEPPINILAVGIPQSLISNLKKFSSRYNFNFSFVNNSSDALFRISSENFEIIISSYFTEPIDGLSFCMAVKNQWKDRGIKFILFPSQDISNVCSLIDQKLLPDKIIIKDQRMYKEFFNYIHELKKTKIEKILFIDDEDSILNIYKMIMEENSNCEIDFYNPKGDYLSQVLSYSPDLIVSDINMPGVNLLELIADLKLVSLKKINYIFLTGDTEAEICQHLIKLGAMGIYDKTTILDNLLGYLTECGVTLIKT